MGILSAAMFFVLSNTKPLERLSAQRPHPNIFCAYVFASLLGQFVFHLVFLATMYHVAKSSMQPVRLETPNVNFCQELLCHLVFLAAMSGNHAPYRQVLHAAGAS